MNLQMSMPLALLLPRSIVYGTVGQCKTESSQKPVPAHSLLLEILTTWRQQQPYRIPDDWVFASRRHRGRKPAWGQAILRKFSRPKAQELGIEKRFGWHTFRHTYSTLLRSVGEEFSDAGVASRFFIAIDAGYLHASDDTVKASSPGCCHVASARCNCRRSFRMGIVARRF
jgi:integrase